MLLRPSTRTLPGNNKTQAERNELHKGLDRQVMPLSPENSERMRSVTDRPEQITAQMQNMGLKIKNPFENTDPFQQIGPYTTRMATQAAKAAEPAALAKKEEKAARARARRQMVPSFHISDTSLSNYRKSHPLSNPVAPSDPTAPSITPPEHDIPSPTTAHTSVQSNSPSKSVTTNVPDMLYVTYQNKTYPVHVEPSTQSHKVNGGTRKHNSNKRKTRKHLH
jgi:hypothetical protein